MYLLSEFKKNKEDNKAKQIAYGTGSVVIGQQAIRSGVPRVLGVRLESHSTSRRNAREIMKGGGYLDPDKGGSGASKLSDDFIKSSNKNVHITGYHGDLAKGQKVTIDMGTGKTPIEYTYTKKDTPLLNVLKRKTQRIGYRGLADVEFDPKDKNNIGKAIKNFPSGLTGLKGRTLYVGGNDKYFNENFTPDADDLALKSNKKVKVYGSRFGAVKATIKKEGLINLMKANKSRVAAGSAILAGGLGASALLAKKALRPSSTSKKKKKRPKFIGGYKK